MNETTAGTEAADPSLRVSYSFARRNGVLLEEDADGHAIAVLRPDASPDAVLELRRADDGDTRLRGTVREQWVSA